MINKQIHVFQNHLFIFLCSALGGGGDFLSENMARFKHLLKSNIL